MKRVITAATAKQGTVIRMVYPWKTAARGADDVDDELCKVYFDTSDRHLALVLALMLRGTYIDAHDVSSNVSEIDIDEELNDMSDQEIIEDLDNTDLGSGEVVIFSVRVDGKLVYNSGLPESEWGRMDSSYANHDPAEGSFESTISELEAYAIQKLKSMPGVEVDTDGYDLDAHIYIDVQDDNTVKPYELDLGLYMHLRPHKSSTDRINSQWMKDLKKDIARLDRLDIDKYPEYLIRVDFDAIPEEKLKLKDKIEYYVLMDKGTWIRDFIEGPREGTISKLNISSSFGVAVDEPTYEFLMG